MIKQFKDTVEFAKMLLTTAFGVGVVVGGAVFLVYLVVRGIVEAQQAGF